MPTTLGSLCRWVLAWTFKLAQQTHVVYRQGSGHAGETLRMVLVTSRPPPPSGLPGPPWRLCPELRSRAPQPRSREGLGRRELTFKETPCCFAVVPRSLVVTWELRTLQNFTSKTVKATRVPPLALPAGVQLSCGG